jgi:hypothetical protein
MEWKYDAGYGYHFLKLGDNELRIWHYTVYFYVSLYNSDGLKLNYGMENIEVTLDVAKNVAIHDTFIWANKNRLFIILT